MQEGHSGRTHNESELTFNTTPNILTLIRMGFVPIIVGCLFVKQPLWDVLAAIAFIIASITDAFDGYIARAQKAVTVYGKLMDPLADKFLVVSSLVMLQELGRIHPVVVIILICREIAITGLRALASAEGVIIAASKSAKWKTATQMVAIPMIMINQKVLGIPIFHIGLVLLYFSLLISLWSAKDYIFGFFKAVKEKRKQKVLSRRLLRQARREARLATRSAMKAKRENKNSD